MMLINDTSALNIKEFELFAGNDTPLGAFQSLGRFQTKNMRLCPVAVAGGKFQPVRVRFFKLHVISAWGEGWSDQPEGR